MPQQQAPTKGFLDEETARRRLKEALERLDDELEEAARRAAPPGGPRGPKGPSFRRPRLPLPNAFDILLDMAVPGYHPPLGNVYCYEATCAASFIGGQTRNTCTPPVPFCFAPLPVTVIPTNYQNYTDAIIANGQTPASFPYWMEWWRTNNPINYVVGKIALMAPGDNAGVYTKPYIFPQPYAEPEDGYAQQPNRMPSMKPDPKLKRRNPEFDETDPPYRQRRSAVIRWRFPQVGVSPGPKPGPGPTPGPKPAPGPQPAPGGKILPPANPRPANKNTKEKKTQFSSYKLYRVVMALFDLYTETQDFVRAIHKALPKSLRCGGPARRHKYDTAGQLKDIWKYADRIDPGKALLNIAANQLEDNVIGRSQQALYNLAGGTGTWQSYSRAKNYDLAMRDAQQRIQEFQKAAGLSEGCK